MRFGGKQDERVIDNKPFQKRLRISLRPFTLFKQTFCMKNIAYIQIKSMRREKNDYSK